MTTRQKILFLLLLLISLFLFFYQLDKTSLVRWDEQTNYFVITSTLRTKTPWILKLGEAMFFEKPPLWYYVLLPLGKIFGTTPLLLRVTTAFIGVSITILIFWVGKKVYTLRTGFLAAFFFLTIPQLFFTNPNGVFATHTLRSGDMDGLFIVFIILALFFFSQSFENKKYFYYGIGWSSLAIMTKGPIGILPILIFIMVNFFQKTKMSFTLKIFLQSLLIYLLITLPWHLFMYLKFGESFVYEYFWYHLLGRATTTLEGHFEPWWFYLKILGTRNFFFLPELSLVATTIVLTNKKLLQNKGTQLFIAFIIVLLGLITITKTRLAWYLLPLYPFLALMVGHGLDNLPQLKHPHPIIKNSPLILSVVILTIGIAKNIYWLLFN